LQSIEFPSWNGEWHLQSLTSPRGLFEPPKSYIDENKIRVQREAQAKIKDLLEYGSEEDFVAAVKSWKKDISQKELLEFIDLYRAARLEKRGLSRRPR